MFCPQSPALISDYAFQHFINWFFNRSVRLWPAPRGEHGHAARGSPLASQLHRVSHTPRAVRAALSHTGSVLHRTVHPDTALGTLTVRVITQSSYFNGQVPKNKSYSFSGSTQHVQFSAIHLELPEYILFPTIHNSNFEHVTRHSAISVVTFWEFPNS